MFVRCNGAVSVGPVTPSDRTPVPGFSRQTRLMEGRSDAALFDCAGNCGLPGRKLIIARPARLAENAGNRFARVRTKWVIVCHCNRLSSDDVVWTLHGMADLDPDRAVTPHAVFAACGTRPRCGNCIGLIARLIEESRMPADE